MKKDNRIPKLSVLSIFIILVAIISITMIILYLFHFRGGISEEIDDWSKFGSYFGSITGLLALLGVLYTIQQSKEQVKLTEERGVFFKMLELYQNQASSVICYEKKGVEAFENIGKLANYYLILYCCLDHLIENPHENINNTEGYEFVALYNFRDSIIENTDLNINEIERIKDLIKDGDLKSLLPTMESAKEYFHILSDKIDLEDQYKAIKYVSILIYKEYYHFLGQYFRTINNLLYFNKDFKEGSQYSRIFRSQLSSYELLVLFYSIFCGSVNTLELFTKFPFFNILLKEDVLFFNPNKYRSFDKYLNDLLHIVTTNNSISR